jgi:hypothetical protein
MLSRAVYIGVRGPDRLDEGLSSAHVHEFLTETFVDWHGSLYNRVKHQFIRPFGAYSYIFIEDNAE